MRYRDDYHDPEHRDTHERHIAAQERILGVVIFMRNFGGGGGVRLIPRDGRDSAGLLRTYERLNV